MTSKLFTPIKLGKIELPNRIIVAPMCMYSADNGSVTDWHLMHLGQFAVSGMGLVFVEATGVEPEGRISPGCVGLWDNKTASSTLIAKRVSIFPDIAVCISDAASPINKIFFTKPVNEEESIEKFCPLGWPPRTKIIFPLADKELKAAKVAPRFVDLESLI